jgi:hypothetical protein
LGVAAGAANVLQLLVTACRFVGRTTPAGPTINSGQVE